jgi:hypothetical protein
MSYKATIRITTLDPNLFANISNVSIANGFRNIGKHFESVAIGSISESVTCNYGNIYGSSILSITSANVTALDTVTINGTVFTAATTPSDTYEYAVGATAMISAKNLAAKINSVPETSALFHAVASHVTTTGTVTVTALAPSSTSYTVSESGSHTSWSANAIVGNAGAISATDAFTITVGNLTANDTVTLGSITLTAVASASAATEFTIGGTAILTAAALAAKINSYAPTAALFSAVASSDTTSGVCTVTVLMPGTIGNMISVNKSATNGSWSGSTFFTGGLNANLTTLTKGL